MLPNWNQTYMMALDILNTIWYHFCESTSDIEGMNRSLCPPWYHLTDFRSAEIVQCVFYMVLTSQFTVAMATRLMGVWSRLLFHIKERGV